MTGSISTERRDQILLIGRPSVFLNVGERTGEGFEIEGGWKPGERFELTGNCAFQYHSWHSAQKSISGNPCRAYSESAWPTLTNWFDIDEY